LPNCMTYLGLYHRVRRAGDGDCNPTPDGLQYLGHTSVTESSKVCQAWASQSPHNHNYDEDNMFPDGSVEDASNYCRIPDYDSDGRLWCYTTDPDTTWEYCNVPACGQSLRSIKGTFVEIKHRFTILDTARAVLSNGPVGPGPRAPNLRGPPNSPGVIFFIS